MDSIQKCQLSDSTFSKNWFIKLLTDNFDHEKFNLFCREVMLLNERYNSTVGLHVTDRPDLIQPYNEKIMWTLDEIDFNQDINFKQL